MKSLMNNNMRNFLKILKKREIKGKQRSRLLEKGSKEDEEQRRREEEEEERIKVGLNTHEITRSCPCSMTPTTTAITSGHFPIVELGLACFTPSKEESVTSLVLFIYDKRRKQAVK